MLFSSCQVNSNNFAWEINGTYNHNKKVVNIFFNSENIWSC